MVRLKKRLFICVFILCFFYAFVYAQTPLKITFIDVGHGDCILIQTPDDGITGNGKYEGKIILIDGGEKVTLSPGKDEAYRRGEKFIMGHA